MVLLSAIHLKIPAPWMTIKIGPSFWKLWNAPRLRSALIGTALFAICRAIDASGLLVSDDSIQLAYLDPGAGSFMIQAVVAALAGIAVTIRAYWSKIKAFFGGKAPESDPDDPAASPDDE